MKISYDWISGMCREGTRDKRADTAAEILADTYECIDGKRIDESPLYDPKNPLKRMRSLFSFIPLDA